MGEIRLTPEQKQQYQEEGYIIVHRLISASDLKELDIMANKALDGELKPQLAYRGQLPEDFYIFWEPAGKDREDIPRRDRIRLMSFLCFHHRYFWDFVRHPAIYSVASQIFDSGIKIFSDTIFVKPPKHGIEAALHQDTAFWPKLEPNALNFWLAIDRATTENGCLHLIPRSHEVDLPHQTDPVQGNILGDDQVDSSKQIPVELEPGGAIFFDSGLAHRSYLNRSEVSRRAMTAVYVAENFRHVEPWKVDLLGSTWDIQYEFEFIRPAMNRFAGG